MVQIIPGKQYMIRRFEDSRRVRVEIDSIMRFDHIRTIAVFGRYIKRDKYSSSIVVGNQRTWSTYPELIEETEQI